MESLECACCQANVVPGSFVGVSGSSTQVPRHTVQRSSGSLGVKVRYGSSHASNSSAVESSEPSPHFESLTWPERASKNSRPTQSDGTVTIVCRSTVSFTTSLYSTQAAPCAHIAARVHERHVWSTVNGLCRCTWLQCHMGAKTVGRVERGFRGVFAASPTPSCMPWLFSRVQPLRIYAALRSIETPPYLFGTPYHVQRPNPPFSHVTDCPILSSY